LREGLDLPEVSLVAVLDADKEGFLRSRVSLVQTCGRAARNIDGRVILYADTQTRSMRAAIEEMLRRRAVQLEYNEKHGITPRGIKKNIVALLDTVYEKDYVELPRIAEPDSEKYMTREAMTARVADLKKEMLAAARKLEFERAAVLRDEISALQKKMLEVEA
jgi:excinuclease ABC subunit B